MDWEHFGNWSGARLYAFALTLCYSRMRYVEFTQRQDSETLLNCLAHAFHYFQGVTATLLTDNMKTVVVERVDGQPQWNTRFLDFAAYYGFVPRACHPYRPQTKGKIESTIRYIKTSFWPGIRFESLADLNRQAFQWFEEANRRVHSTTREVPIERWAQEHLLSVAGRWRTGFIESFNGRLRDECLNVEWFASLEDARQKLARFRQHYNHQRPHSALADRTPALNQAKRTSPARNF